MNITVTADTANTIAMLKNVPETINGSLRLGIMKAVQHLRTMVDKNLSSGEFNIKSGSRSPGGRLRASLQTLMTGTNKAPVGIVGTNLVYARIQEEGGTTHPNVTLQMRKFFWAKFRDTGDEKWKWMALMKKSKLSINIPAHWYMRQTMQREVNKVNDIINNSISVKS